MPIRLIINKHPALTAAEMDNLVVAIDNALRELDSPGRREAMVSSLAKKIIELAKNGERDHVRLLDFTFRWVRESANEIGDVGSAENELTGQG